MSTHNFKNLNVWIKSRALIKEVYQLVETFPNDELYGLSSQIKRSAISIPSNIAEGSGRGSDKDFERFLRIALGSSFELQTQLIISEKLGIIGNEDFDNTNNSIEELKKMIWGFKKSLTGKSVSLTS